MSRKKKSRREFLSDAGGAAAAATAAAAGFSVGCGDQVTGPTITDLNPDSLKAIMDGVVSPVQMTRLGGFGTETVASGANSTPKDLIESYEWYVGRDGLEGHTSLVKYGEELDIKFPFSGESILELKVRGGPERRSLNSTRAIIEVTLPVLVGETEYEETQIAFFRWERDSKAALHFMDRDSPELVSRILQADSAEYFDIEKVAWAPTAEKIVVAARDILTDNDTRLIVLNTLTGERSTITRGIGTVTPDWSPTGDWIAYRTNDRNSAAAEIAFIRPDGSERFFLSGESPRDSYNGTWPRFDRTGARLAVGGVSGVENIRIFDDLWGTPYMRALLSQDQIKDFADKMSVEETGMPTGPSLDALLGYYGLDWSPDGKYIVFGLDMNEHQDPVEESFAFRGIVKVEVDNRDAEIELLAKDHVMRPSYSPDGSSIFYDTVVYPNNHINRMDPDGNNAVDLTLVSGAPYETIDRAATRR